MSLKPTLGAVVLFILLLLWRPAAAEVSLVYSAKPIDHPYLSAKSEIEGVGLGMSVATVKAVLSSRFPGSPVTAETQVLKLERNGKRVQTTPFISRLSIPGLYVDFGAPTTGSTVVGITHDERPSKPGEFLEITTAFSRLVEMFGPESGPVRVTGDGYAFASWVFDAQRKLACADHDCAVAVSVPLHVDAPDEEMNLAMGRHLLITATAIPADTNPKYATRVTVVVDDIDNRYLTQREARRQLDAAISTSSDQPR